MSADSQAGRKIDSTRTSTGRQSARGHQRSDACSADHPETRGRNAALLGHLGLRELELLTGQQGEIARKGGRNFAERPIAHDPVAVHGGGHLSRLHAAP